MGGVPRFVMPRFVMPRVGVPRFGVPRTPRSLSTTMTLRRSQRKKKKSEEEEKQQSQSQSQSRGGDVPRFFCPHLPPSMGGVVRVQGHEFWHMSRVLRLSTTDRVELFNGKGGLVRGCIHTVDRTGLDFLALEDPISLLPSPTNWHVFSAFGTLKGGRSDWLLEKCTELGAHTVTPLLTERCPSMSDNRVDRLQRVVLAATKQCRRLHEMVLNQPMKVDALLPLVSKSKLCFLATAEATPVVSVLSSSRKEASGMLIIGPEGDFTEKEINAMIEAGAVAVGLGPLRLRVETATVALLATLMLWSDSQEISGA